MRAWRMDIFDDDTALDIMTWHPDSRFSATGSATITWIVRSGALPPGFSLNEDTGLLSGVATQSGSFSFLVEARNSYGFVTREFTMNVVGVRPTIQIASMQNATAWQPYDFSFQAIGCEPITWAVESGALPPGLSLNAETGLLSGIPTEAGEFSFYIVARNDYGESIRNFSISVAAPPPGSPFIQTESLADAVVGYSYFQTLQATGDSPMVWTIHNGFLPPGLSLHATAGTISGTPTTSGRFTFTLRVANVPGAHMRTFTISVYNPPDTPPLY